MNRTLASRLRSAGPLWSGVPIGLVAGVLVGLFRTVRPLRWPDGVPFDGESIPLWPFVVLGGLAGLLPLAGHFVRLGLADARRRAAVAAHPGALIVWATATPQTAAALLALAGPPSVAGRSLLLVLDRRGLVVGVIGCTGAAVRSISLERSRLVGAQIRERSATVAMGRDVWVTVDRGDGSLFELPFTLRSEELGAPDIALLTAFAERARPGGGR